LTAARWEKIEVHLDEFARGPVITLGNLIGLFRRLGAGVPVHLQRHHDTADFIGRAHQLNPVPGRQRRRGVMVVHLHIDLHRPGRLLFADEPGEIPGPVARDEAQDVAQAVFVREPAVLRGERRRQPFEAGGGDGLDFPFEGPLPGR
jgi:hypothetical protein